MIDRAVLVLWRTVVTLCLIVGLAAVLLIAGVLFLSARGVPERYLEQVRAAAARHGVGMSVERAVWRPWSTLRVESPSVRLTASPEMRLRARRVDLAFAVDMGGAPTATLRRVSFLGAHLVCPPPPDAPHLPALEWRDVTGSVALEAGQVAVSAAGHGVGLADVRVSGRMLRRRGGAPAPSEIGEQIAATLRRATEAQARVLTWLRELDFEQPPSLRVELSPGDAAGGVGGVRVVAEGGRGHWRSAAFDRWNAEVAWSADGRVDVRRLQIRWADGRVDAEGDADLRSGAFTVRAAGTLRPSLAASLAPAFSNAPPTWVALVQSHPPVRADVVVSGVMTHPRAAAWTLAWDTAADPRSAPLVAHRADLAGSNGLVRVRSADVSCRRPDEVVTDQWRRRLEAYGVALGGGVRARFETGPEAAPPAEAWRSLRAHVEAERVQVRGITLLNGRAAVDLLDGGGVRVELVDAGVEAPGPDGRLSGRVDHVPADQATVIRAYFRGDPASLLTALPPGTRQALEPVRFEAPANVDVACRLDSGTSLTWRADVQLTAPRLTVRREPVEMLDLSLSIEPGHVRARRMHAVVGGGLVSGAWTYDWDAGTLDLDISSSANPHAVARAIGPTAEATISEVKAAGPVWATLAGTIPLGGTRAGLALRAHVAGEGIGWGRVVAQRMRGVVEIDSTNVLITVSDAQWCNGTVSGQMTLPLEAGRSCAMNWQVTDAAYPEVSRLLGRDRDEQRDAGLLSGHIRLTGPLGTNFLATATGAGGVHLRNGYIMSMPLFGGLSAYLSALIPGFGYAEQREAKADFVVADNRVTTDNARLLGRMVSVGIRGSYGFDGQLDFRVEVLFLKDGITATVTRLVTAPLTKALEFRLTGTYKEPQWWPLNTPTRLLNFFGRQLGWISGGTNAPADSAP